MKKSIYYLIANTVSIIAAAIFLSCINGNNFPIFGFNLEVTKTLLDTFEPLKYILIVEALAIITCTYECVNADKKSNPVLDIIGAVVTVATIFFTWFSAVLIFDNYRMGATINLPIVFLATFVVGLVCVLLSGVVSKKNDVIGGLLPLTGVLVLATGITFECLELSTMDNVYKIIILAVMGVVSLLPVVIPTIVSASKKNVA